MFSFLLAREHGKTFSQLLLHLFSGNNFKIRHSGTIKFILTIVFKANKHTAVEKYCTNTEICTAEILKTCLKYMSGKTIVPKSLILARPVYWVLRHFLELLGLLYLLLYRSLYFHWPKLEETQLLQFPPSLLSHIKQAKTADLWVPRHLSGWKSTGCKRWLQWVVNRREHCIF